MNLIKELQKKSDTAEKKMQEQLDDVKLLIAHDESREREMLNHLGVDKCITQYEDKRSSYFQKQSLVKRYGKEIFHIDQIKEICVDYDLRLLNTQYFQGWVDTELGSKLRNFVDEQNIPEHELKSSFFIMAPTHQFRIEEKIRSPKTYDPVLFYRIDDENYLLIHQWGKELNWMRYITAFPKRSFLHSQIHYFVVAFAIIMVALSVFNLTSLVMAIGMALGLSSMFIFLRHRYLTNENEKDINEPYNVNLWNTNLKIK